ncbi:MAG: nitrogen-fixing NifU domain protein [Firmicutes bacterium]|nr:nitrogen-fixing NifU domain protein [Bacillota bacterium]
MYSEKVMEHFMMPQNVGFLLEPDGMGIAGESCSDNVKMYIQVRGGIITQIRFLVFGCCAAIACASMTTVLAQGKSIDNALQITEQEVVSALEGLPEEKQHCSNMGVAALKAAIQDYLTRTYGI